MINLHSFAESQKPAQTLAAALGITHHLIDLHKFPDGESLVTVTPGAGTALLYADLHEPNAKLMPLFLTADALRRNGATRLVLVAPYLCYMRQDKAFAVGQAVGQQVMGKLFAERFDRIVTVEAHLHRTHDLHDVFPGREADNLRAAPVIAAALHHDNLPSPTFIIGPDEESTPIIAALANALGQPYRVGAKTRHGDRHVSITFTELEAIKGHRAVIVDDMVSSGGTLITTAQQLLAAGATQVDAVVTHALFPDSVTEKMKAVGIASVRSTDSLPHATNAIPLAPFLTEALRKEIP